jgi:hypothetical protein
MIFGNIFNENMDNVYTFAAMMKSSAYVISHSCFLFSTLLFRGKVVNFLHVLLSFSISIYFISISSDSNVNYVKTHISLLVPLLTVSAILIFFRYEIKNYPQFSLGVIMAVSDLSINIVTVLFIN